MRAPAAGAVGQAGRHEPDARRLVRRAPRRRV